MVSEVPRPDEEVGLAESARGFTFAAVVLIVGFTLGWLAQFGVPGLDGFATVWPQRWSFFTKLDRNSVVAYRQAGAHDPLAQLEPIGFIGLNRAAEARYFEVRQVALKVPDDYWQTCARQYPAECGLDLDAGRVYRMKNGSRGSYLCGRLVLAVERTEQPVPRTLPSSPTRVQRLAVVDLECMR